jgi:Predicted integral membrane protein
MSLKKVFVLIILVGLTVRLVLMPLLTYEYDIYHWGVIVANINSGNNLYDLTGYFYTPVWGYMMGAITAFSDLFLNVDVMGVRFTNMLPIEDLEYRFHIATISTISFNLMMKAPFVLCDIIVGYILYKLILKFTEDKRKAVYGFALWFLCPIVIYMSSVQAMFDTISALLLLVTVLLLYKDKCFLAGALFSTVFLLKFFPAFCIFVFIGYIWVKHRDDGLAKRKVAEAALGAVIMTVILFLPQVLNGQMEDTLSFIVGRVSADTNIRDTIMTTAGIAIALFGMLYFGYKMFKTPKEGADRALFTNTLMALVCAMFMSFGPQYVIVMIPLLIIHIFTTDINYRKCWILISVSTFAVALTYNNFSLLCSIAEYTSLVDTEWILSAMRTLEGVMFNVTYREIIIFIFNVIECIGLLLILLFHFSDRIYGKWPEIGSAIIRVKNMGAKRSEI